MFPDIEPEVGHWISSALSPKPCSLGTRYRDLSGHQRTKTFESRASAKAWLTSTETDMNRGCWIDPRLTVTTLGVIAEHWMKSADGKRAGPIARDQSILANHVLPALGHKAVGTVTRHDVQQLVSGWAARYTPSTAARHYTSRRGLLSYAKSCALITRSSCRGIRVPAAVPRKAKILDAAQLQRLSQVMGTYDPVAYLAVLGLRWGEVAGIRIGDIDFLRYAVNVVRQRTRGAKGRMIEQDPKTRARRRSLSVQTRTPIHHLMLAARQSRLRSPTALAPATPANSGSEWRQSRFVYPAL